MATLLEKQIRFTELVSQLITWAYYNGYGLTFGDAYRDPRCPYGKKKSLHKSRLAVDFNLFINGKYTHSTESHRPLGEYWESLDPECTWGGRFKDGNHYSYGEKS